MYHHTIHVDNSASHTQTSFLQQQLNHPCILPLHCVFIIFSPRIHTVPTLDGTGVEERRISRGLTCDAARLSPAVYHHRASSVLAELSASLTWTSPLRPSCVSFRPSNFPQHTFFPPCLSTLCIPSLPPRVALRDESDRLSHAVITRVYFILHFYCTASSALSTSLHFHSSSTDNTNPSSATLHLFTARCPRLLFTSFGSSRQCCNLSPPASCRLVHPSPWAHGSTRTPASSYSP